MANLAPKTANNFVPGINSPFFSRAYGGYTNDQIEFYSQQLNGRRIQTLLDPMAGQAFALADYSYSEVDLWLCDINPALGLMAMLRSPELIIHHRSLVEWFVTDVLGDPTLYDEQSRELHYVDTWVDPFIELRLNNLRDIVGATHSPFSDTNKFWKLPKKARFGVAIAILAARQLTCYRSTDNRTWSKPGGLARPISFANTLKSAALAWQQYALNSIENHPKLKSGGSLSFRKIDAARGNLSELPRVDSIITSPPYANRLDYSRMWAQETAIAAAIWKETSEPIKRNQIGSNIVKGTQDNEQTLKALPKSLTKALEAIRDDPTAYAGKTYYYPYFRNYATDLTQTLFNLAHQTKRKANIVIFIRDTVRKDVLFETGKLVIWALSERGFTLKAQHEKVIKNHVGMKRRRSQTGFYGIGQREWWLSFQRNSK